MKYFLSYIKIVRRKLTFFGWVYLLKQIAYKIQKLSLMIYNVLFSYYLLC